MYQEFKAETFRDDFTFSNSPEAVRRFPFPFWEDKYMYSVNIEPHTKGPVGSIYEFPIDIDEHYVSEMKDRALVLKEDPLRCQALPNMMVAQWDLLELLMTPSMARDYPQWFSLQRDGLKWHWINLPLGIEQSFVASAKSTLSRKSRWSTSRANAKATWPTSRPEGNSLWMDAGISTTQADWSLDFDVGMNFMEWHGPVPLAHEARVFDRALKFLLNLQQESPVRRLNWTMTIIPRLDTSPENYNKWGKDRASVTADNVARKFICAWKSRLFGACLGQMQSCFPLRAYLISLEQLVTVRKWARRLHRVLQTLPPELIDYKGIARYRDVTIDFLSRPTTAYLHQRVALRTRF